MAPDRQIDGQTDSLKGLGKVSWGPLVSQDVEDLILKCFLVDFCIRLHSDISSQLLMVLKWMKCRVEGLREAKVQNPGYIRDR